MIVVIGDFLAVFSLVVDHFCLGTFVHPVVSLFDPHLRVGRTGWR